MGYFEPGGGYLRVEACVAANLQLAQCHGASIQLGSVVRSISQEGIGVKIVTDGDTIRAAKVAVTAGAWARTLLGAPFSAVLKPTRQAMHWFGIEPDYAEVWRRAPVFMWPNGDQENGFFYDFPSMDGMTMKTADEFYGAAANPDAIDRQVSAADSDRMRRTHLVGLFSGLSNLVSRTAACIYTATPDSGFVIDWHPRMTNVLTAPPLFGAWVQTFSSHWRGRQRHHAGVDDSAGPVAVFL